MFTIDLLKGDGRPVRTKPQGVAIFVATFAVPALIALVMVGYYTRNNIVISVRKQNINSLDIQIKRLSDAIKFRESSEKEKASITSCLTDIASAINKHKQWSPILMSLLENLPDSVVINSLDVKRGTIKRKGNAAVSAGKKIDPGVFVRTLRIKVSGNPSRNCDLEVKSFRDRLKASKDLGPKLDDVIIASQGHEVVDNQDLVTYDIDCIFKPGL
jgi:Tfp pilus assembly protein PilN